MHPEDDGQEPEVPAPSTSETVHSAWSPVIEVSDTDSDRTEELNTENEQPPPLFKVKMHNLRK